MFKDKLIISVTLLLILVSLCLIVHFFNNTAVGIAIMLALFGV